MLRSERMVSLFDGLLYSLQAKLVGVDEQERELRGIFEQFSSSSKGDSCVLLGDQKSGRTSLVDKICRVYPNWTVNSIYVGQLGSDATAKSIVNNSEMKHRVVVVEDADELVSRQRQSLLYSFLDCTRQYPWLVILMSCRQDFKMCLEKRVLSRLSPVRVFFSRPFKFDDYLSALNILLKSSTTSNEIERDWNLLVDTFLSSRKMQKEVHLLFEFSLSYADLKTCACVFLGWLSRDADPTVEEMSTVWEESMESVLQMKRSFNSVIHDLPRRTLCVLLCAARRLSSCTARGYENEYESSIAYSKVVLDYKHMSNIADARMRVTHDVILFKEIDRLVQLGLLISDRKANNIAYKRVSLNGDMSLLKEAIKQYPLPMPIKEWYNSIITN